MTPEMRRPVLEANDRLIVGDELVVIGEELAGVFVEGDRIIGIAETGEILHLPRADTLLVDEAVTRSHQAFVALQTVTEEAIDSFFATFVRLLSADSTIALIQAANDIDVQEAKARGRSTKRLLLDERMRLEMVASLRIWENSPVKRESVVERIEHEGWTVESVRAPLGVIGFVFEGRPNVFADATGVLRSGNTCVLRIGSDALGTASAMMKHAIQPALLGSGLPANSVQLIEAKSHAAAWALFSNPGVALAIARGSGPAVATLGAVARQAGLPVSLHGTGGAWLIAGESAKVDSFEEIVAHSLDRKVCNTVNVVCIPQSRVGDLLPALERGIVVAASSCGTAGLAHLVREHVPINFEHNPLLDVRDLTQDELSIEWEWDTGPECSIIVVRDVAAAIELCNRYSPQFIVSLVSEDEAEHRKVWHGLNAPFVGNGMTRWVDGQFALLRPELGLSNWQFGRLLGRSGILSGDSVYTVRLRATQHLSSLHR